jgi:hypothetical protein
MMLMMILMMSEWKGCYFLARRKQRLVRPHIWGWNASYPPYIRDSPAPSFGLLLFHMYSYFVHKHMSYVFNRIQ